MTKTTLDTTLAACFLSFCGACDIEDHGPSEIDEDDVELRDGIWTPPGYNNEFHQAIHFSTNWGEETNDGSKELSSVIVKLGIFDVELDSVWSENGRLRGQGQGYDFSGEDFLGSEWYYDVSAEGLGGSGGLGGFGASDVLYMVITDFEPGTGSHPDGYRFNYYHAGGSTTDLCFKDYDPDHLAIVLEDVVLYLDGTAEEVPNRLMIACKVGGAAKAALWGYGPDVVGIDGYQTAVRAVIGDYCGDGNGYGYTNPGTWVWLRDSWGIHTSTPPHLPIEAGWGPGGATCLTDPRNEADMNIVCQNGMDPCASNLVPDGLTIELVTWDWDRGGHVTQDVPAAGDYNGDGRDDLLCHATDVGSESIDYADGIGHFLGDDWSHDANWCSASSGRLLKGDFNGDGRTDLLCHDLISGSKEIDDADANGEFNGTDWTGSIGWCSELSQQILIGDYNGDGRDDLLCHDYVLGNVLIDYATAQGRFYGTNWSRDANWCHKVPRDLFIGDFNGDGKDDMLCRNPATGANSIDYADANGQFMGQDWGYAANFCAGTAKSLLIGDFEGNGRDDMFCHDSVSGMKWVDGADVNGRFYGTNWSLDDDWCIGSTKRVSTGDYNGDGRDDILCHDTDSGLEWIDYANASGQFLAIDWSSAGGWCDTVAQELH